MAAVKQQSKQVHTYEFSEAQVKFFVDFFTRAVIGEVEVKRVAIVDTKVFIEYIMMNGTGKHKILKSKLLI